MVCSVFHNLYYCGRFFIGVLGRGLFIMLVEFVFNLKCLDINSLWFWQITRAYIVTGNINN